jgi:hypothetical protein
MPGYIEVLIWIAAPIAALATISGGILAVRGISKRLEAIGEAVLGKSEVTDFSGAVIEPAVPSLQARVSSLETLVRDSTQEANQHEGRVAALERWREDHTRETDTLMTRMMDHIIRESEAE